MDESLEVVLRRLTVGIRTDAPAAFEDIARLAQQYPEEPKVWRTLAYAHEARGDHAAAIAAVTRAIALDAREPGLFLDRGYYALNAGDYERAVADFSQGLDLHDEPNWDYYHDVLRIMRAAGFYRLGKKAEALADLAHVRDAYVLWKGENWSKAELSALCGEEAPAGGSESPDPDEPALPESPDEEEAALATKLGADGLEAVDAALLKHMRARYQKAARVIGDAIEDGGFPIDDSHVRLFARRLNVLADAGVLSARGNLHKPYRSEVRLPKRP
jgi:tetratricopeptide (TPR) repeat protein